MCRSLISVGHDGRIYDCDFNQMLEMDAADAAGRPLTHLRFRFRARARRPIRFDATASAALPAPAAPAAAQPPSYRSGR